MTSIEKEGVSKMLLCSDKYFVWVYAAKEGKELKKIMQTSYMEATKAKCNDKIGGRVPSFFRMSCVHAWLAVHFVVFFNLDFR